MKTIQIKISNTNSVAYNLALEEYLITESTEDILLFYINTDAVVIGKHQNPWKEVDLAPIDNQKKKHNVIRRLSGGGTVFHDLGNINFSYIRNKDTDFVNFREHIEPISSALAQLGIDNTISPRNDIFVNDHKVSGNAEHVNSKAKRILHHGTLLYDSNLVKLNGSIKPKRAHNIQTHAVNSVRSPVMNMREIANHGDTKNFLSLLVEQIKGELHIASIETISPQSIEKVEKLVLEKYENWEWNFGHTPQFSYTNEQGLTFKIRKGVVIECDDKTQIGVRCDKIINHD